VNATNVGGVTQGQNFLDQTLFTVNDDQNYYYPPGNDPNDISGFPGGDQSFQGAPPSASASKAKLQIPLPHELQQMHRSRKLL
jgi:hypothetical protein